MAAPSRALSLEETCERIGVSLRTGVRLLSDGRFPVPSLPRHGSRSWHRFSTFEIERYLQTASLQDARR